MRSDISMTHTPVSRCPSINAYWMGAAPRYAGRRDGWTFTLRDGRKRVNSELGRIRPKEAVTSKWPEGGSYDGSTGVPEGRKGGGAYPDEGC